MHEQPGFTRFVEVAPGGIRANDTLPYENIRERTDIVCRNIAGPGDTIESIGLQAVHALYETLNIAGRDCGGLVLSTSACTDDPHYAANAARRIAHAAGIRKDRAVIDGVNYACSGFPAAVARAQKITAERDGHVVVVSAEIFSRMIDWGDESTAVLFGDRAAATSLHTGGHTVLESRAWELEDGDALIGLEHREVALSPEGETRPGEVLRMNGRALYRTAPGIMVRLVRESMERLGLRAADVSAIVPHQANGRFMRKIALLLAEKDENRDGHSWDHVWIANEISHMANVGSASIPCALARIQDTLLPGRAVICPAVGAGPSFKGGTLTEGVLAFRMAGDAL